MNLRFSGQTDWQSFQIQLLFPDHDQGKRWFDQAMNTSSFGWNVSKFQSHLQVNQSSQYSGEIIHHLTRSDAIPDDKKQDDQVNVREPIKLQICFHPASFHFEESRYRPQMVIQHHKIHSLVHTPPLPSAGKFHLHSGSRGGPIVFHRIGVPEYDQYDNVLTRPLLVLGGLKK